MYVHRDQMKWIETVGVKLRIYMWISRKEKS